MKYRIAAAALVLLLLAVAGAKAQSDTTNNKKKQKTPPTQTAANKIRGASTTSAPVFSPQEIAIIQDYFKTNSLESAKQESLSAAQERQLVKNGKLPSSLKKKVQPLPIELERRLPVLPTGYRRVAISSHVIVMNSSSGLICDVIRDAIP